MRFEPGDLSCPVSPSGSMCVYFWILVFCSILFEGKSSWRPNIITSPWWNQTFPKRGLLIAWPSGKRTYLGWTGVFSFLQPFISALPVPSCFYVTAGINVTRSVLHGSYRIYSWKYKLNFCSKAAQCGLFREPGCVTLIEIPVRVCSVWAEEAPAEADTWQTLGLQSDLRRSRMSLIHAGHFPSCEKKFFMVGSLLTLIPADVPLVIQNNIRVFVVLLQLFRSSHSFFKYWF